MEESKYDHGGMAVTSPQNIGRLNKANGMHQ